MELALKAVAGALKGSSTISLSALAFPAAVLAPLNDGRSDRNGTAWQWRRSSFLPLGFAHSSRTKKACALPSSAPLRPGSTSLRLVPGRVQGEPAPVSQIAIEALRNAASKQQ